MNSCEDRFHLGAKALIRNKEGKILLLEKEKRDKSGTYWDLPGGRMNRGETLIDALRRELEEEIALKTDSEATYVSMHLSRVRIPQQDGDVGLILALYAFDKPLDFTPQLSKEHSNWAWYDLSEACSLLPSHCPSGLINDIHTYDSAKIPL